MIWIICVFILFFSSCEQKSQERHYTEIIVGSPSDNAQGLFWTVPQGWKQEEAASMRLATFHQITDPDAIDCSITALAGPAGGLDANLGRWLGQLGFQVSDDNVNQLAASAQIFRTKDGLEAKVFDFTTLQTQGSPLDKSMVAAMIGWDETTVFIKMTGSIESVKKNKDNFLKLLGSITRK